MAKKKDTGQSKKGKALRGKRSAASASSKASSSQNTSTKSPRHVSSVSCCAFFSQYKRPLLWSAACIILILLVFALLSLGSSSRTVTVGDVVSVRYVGSTDKGVFDTNIASVAERHGLESSLDILTFTVGGGQVIQGFDEAVLGMREGERKTVTIPAQKAYGAYRADLVQSLPLDDFIEMFPDVEPVEGASFVAYTDTGSPVLLRFKQVGFDFVTLDMNHELAGKELTFEIRLTAIS